MYDATKEYFSAADIIIFAAAVADYTPTMVADKKIKKAGESLDLTLKKSIDIAQTLGTEKKKHQFSVGFALETENELAHAQEKIKKKNFDLIVLNSLNDDGAGFGHPTNKITLIDKANNIQHFELKSKKEVAKDIIEAIIQNI